MGEGFGEDRPAVDDADGVAEPGDVGIVGDGGDAVDHGAGEDGFGFDPAGEALVLQALVLQALVLKIGEREDGVAEHVAVVLDVVAGEQGGGRALGVAAAAQGFDEDADGAGGLVGVGEVLLDQGVFGVEALGGAIEAVAVFGDGEADDANGIGVDGAQEVGGGLAGENHARERADHGCGGRFLIALD